MTYKETILAHPSFPKIPADLRQQVINNGYETVNQFPWNKQAGLEVRLDFVRDYDGKAGFKYFYLDADRNPGQLTNPNLIMGSVIHE